MTPADEPERPDGEDLPVDGPETAAEQRLLASFGRRARTVNLGRVLRLLELLDVSDEGRLDERGRGEAENLAHQVVGSAGTFGYPAASADAAVIEGYFALARRGGSGADAPVVRRTLDRLRALFEDPAQR